MSNQVRGVYGKVKREGMGREKGKHGEGLTLALFGGFSESFVTNYYGLKKGGRGQQSGHLAHPPTTLPIYTPLRNVNGEVRLFVPSVISKYWYFNKIH